MPAVAVKASVKRCLDIAADDDLGGIALAHVLRPGVPKVAEPLIKQPSMKNKLKSIQLEILSQIELRSAPKRIGVRGIQAQLV